MASVRFRLGAMVLGTIVGLIFVEAGLRAGARWIFNDNPVIPDAVLGWALQPDFRGWATDENVVWVENNSAGWHDRERALVAAPGTLRVAVIGDSFVHAYYLTLDEAFGATLERALVACGRAPRVEVLSFGALQYNTTQELLTYREHAARYRPDVVMVVVNPANDIFENHPSLSTELAPRYLVDDTGSLVLDTSFREHLPPPPRWPLRRRIYEAVLRHSRTLQLLWMVHDRIPGGSREDHGSNDEDAPEVDQLTIYQPPATPAVQQAWALTEAVILKFAEEVRRDGREFWITTMFAPSQVHPDLEVRRAAERDLGVSTLLDPERRLTAFARAHGVNVVPLAEPVADYTATHGVHVMGGSTRDLPPGTGHWNAFGAALAADLVAQEMCRTASGPSPHP